MRMIYPGLRERRTVDRRLTSFFRGHNLPDFRRAVGSLSRFYDLPTPRVDWYEYLDWGKTAGRTYENGKIQLVHPENWKRGRKYNSERQWIHTVYHEMGHYVLWADAERKADGFAYSFVRGVFGGQAGIRSRAANGELSRARRKRYGRSRPAARRSRPRPRRRRARSR
jgi:hypothetical protein